MFGSGLMNDKIIIKGARENNLKNVDLTLPRNSLIVMTGLSGSGKTSMIYEPMLARDLEKKYFFKEASKEMGYTALRTGLAMLEKPYSNDYLNKNFSLNMLNFCILPPEQNSFFGRLIAIPTSF